MKFVRRELTETADVSKGKGGQLWELGKLTLITIGIVLALYLIIGVVVDLVVSNISIETEKKLFGSKLGPQPMFRPLDESAKPFCAS